jgi:transposase
MSATCQYETDVTDAQWDLLHPLLPKHTWTPGSRGRPPRPLRRGGQWYFVREQDGLPVAHAA